MRLRRVQDGGAARIEVDAGGGFVALGDVLSRLPVTPAEAATWSHDMIAFLAAPTSVRADVGSTARTMAAAGVANPRGASAMLPFEPRSFRDFMIYERHAIDAARGFVRSFMPRLAPLTRAYEAATGRDFPAFRPKRLWHRQPVYYMGNHLAFVPDGAAIVRPAYTRALDFELELGIVLARPLYNATPAVAEQAIGGFVVVNDLSARDVQLDEMASGFGPQKAKHFANAVSTTVATADAILPRWRQLQGTVVLNGRRVAEPTTANPRWSLGEMLAHASLGEHLLPGELLATGTLPGGSGIESGHLLVPGDVIEVGIEGIGTVANRIVSEEEAQA